MISCPCGRPTLDGLCDSCASKRVVLAPASASLVRESAIMARRAERRLERTGTYVQPVVTQAELERAAARRASKERARKLGLDVAKGMRVLS